MQVIVSGSFDNLRSSQVRFLQEAARLGEVQLFLLSDNMIFSDTGKPPVFPEAERRYLLESIRYVSRVCLIDRPLQAGDLAGKAGGLWMVEPAGDTPEWRALCTASGITGQVIDGDTLRGFPAFENMELASTAERKKVLVTGCYDWLHSGHVRFFEEAAQYGDLYVVVGHDANVRQLKGEGHPLFSQEERRYMVQSVRFVTQALVSSGWGWMDAAPEIERIRPHIYAVNEDGDRPEKRAFCDAHGLEYLVLRREPKPGLPRRESTKLRGF